MFVTFFFSVYIYATYQYKLLYNITISVLPFCVCSRNSPTKKTLSSIKAYVESTMRVELTCLGLIKLDTPLNS